MEIGTFLKTTVLRVYGSELKPYKLPFFLTPRVFAIEYIRQRLNSDHIHFTSRNQKTSLMLPVEVFSFILKTRATFNIVEKMMKDFHFEEDKFWQYDPCRLISNMRIVVGYVPYIHHKDAGTKGLANRVMGRNSRNIARTRSSVNTRKKYEGRNNQRKFWINFNYYN